MSSRSGPIRATVRPRSLPSNNTSTSSSHAAYMSSSTSSRPPPLSRHSRHSSLESLTSSLSHRLTVSSGSRTDTVVSNDSHHRHHRQQQQPLQHGMVKSASTGHLAAQSLTANTSQCLKDYCPPLNAARLRPIRYQTRNTTVSQACMHSM